MEIRVRVPGSCGELLQGVAGTTPFLVTAPVNRYTTVFISDTGRPAVPLGEKSRSALRRTLAYLGESRFPFSLSLCSELPQGKGMASSSADVSAVIIATAAAFGRRLSEAETAVLATSVEPTDGIFCRGIVAFDHVHGAVLHRWTEIPPYCIAVFDMGGSVDTLALHRKLATQGEKRLRLPAETLCSMTVDDVLQAAAESLFLNQEILRKPQLGVLAATARQYGAVSICGAHSGTVVGAFFPVSLTPETVRQMGEEIAAAFPEWRLLDVVRLIDGGYEMTCR
ncbi:GHMP kinase [Megasphaera vaginalis (ex Srinivasan et al. 2021)]|uniref:GHMP kinase, N-terminal domain protein n=1 Tax=Megasphaera vaginalis (ex Srinivasan et al. 2021) TaxID=1111454 RepID=U7UMT9_9FIRM|nr:GHMP kinase [Megasphaera vaginalis (ex Srinivasan et al. 2021)]ERT60747.1 GHMP kinase, N-terminal domain protein [Megasphaera vaginalis (ex Srinivasan et al. 2021)]